MKKILKPLLIKTKREQKYSIIEQFSINVLLVGYKIVINAIGKRNNPKLHCEELNPYNIEDSKEVNEDEYLS